VLNYATDLIPGITLTSGGKNLALDLMPGISLAYEQAPQWRKSAKINQQRACSQASITLMSGGVKLRQ